MSKRKKLRPIFYGLHELLVAFRWAADNRQGAVICRASPLIREFSDLESSADLHLLSARPTLMVGQVMNFLPLLEARRAFHTDLNTLETLDAFIRDLGTAGYAFFRGADLDALKGAGTITWGTFDTRFQSRERKGDIQFRFGVGSAVTVPAFSTCWLDTQAISRKAYEYLRKQAYGEEASVSST